MNPTEHTPSETSQNHLGGEQPPNRYNELVAAGYETAGIPPQDRDPTLAAQIEQAVIELTAQLAGPDRRGEGYLEKLGRLNAARNQATEIVLNDLLPRPTPTPASPTSSTTSSTSPSSRPSPTDGEAMVPASWPLDPDHPLNDPDRVEQMSEAEIASRLAAFDRQQQDRYDAEPGWRESSS